MVSVFPKDMSLRGEWLELLSPEFEKGYMAPLCEFVEQEYAAHSVFPPRQLVFNALNLTAPQEVKVVILGQDPYHGQGEAHGLAFSVPQGVRIPPSLRNIFKEISSDIPATRIPESGNLERWARQGVLLLNTVLTVRMDSPRSHAGHGWEQFTDAIIRQISEQQSGVVFILWGKDAASKSKLIDESKHLILTSPHPSPLSAHRGFFGSRPFSQANSWLLSRGRQPVEW